MNDTKHSRNVDQKRIRINKEMLKYSEKWGNKPYAIVIFQQVHHNRYLRVQDSLEQIYLVFGVVEHGATSCRALVQSVGR